MIAQELEVSLHMAFMDARQKRHEFITVEHLLLALLGGVAGILLAWWARAMLWSIRPPMLRNQQLDFAIDLRVLLFSDRTVHVCHL